MTTKSAHSPVSAPANRSASEPPSRYRGTITFTSMCPKCGHERAQHGYTRRILFSLLNAHRRIEAFCFVCNACWPISEREQSAISARMNAALS
jgi:hypothetical protein